MKVADFCLGSKAERLNARHMFSALPLRTDIAECGRHVGKVQEAALDSNASDERRRT